MILRQEKYLIDRQEKANQNFQKFIQNNIIQEKILNIVFSKSMCQMDNSFGINK